MSYNKIRNCRAETIFIEVTVFKWNDSDTLRKVIRNDNIDCM